MRLASIRAIKTLEQIDIMCSIKKNKFSKITSRFLTLGRETIIKPSSVIDYLNEFDIYEWRKDANDNGFRFIFVDFKMLFVNHSAISMQVIFKRSK